MEKKIIFENILTCPICNSQLEINIQEKFMKCEKNHSYDIAKQGYTNLLISNQKKSLNPGDSKEMVDARTSFFESGLYEKVIESVLKTIEEYAVFIENSTILDLGTGEGYYFNKIQNSVSPKFPLISYIGLDISKEAIKVASKRNKSICWIVSSNFKPPIQKDSINLILTIFSPINYSVCSSLLNREGLLLRVLPAENHLLEIRELIYDDVFKKEKEYMPNENDNLKLVKTVNINYKIAPDSDVLLNLLKMTPHFWRTNSIKIEDMIKKLKGDITIDMQIYLFKKNN